MIKSAQHNPNLSLFQVPPTDLSTVSSRWVKIPPLTSSITPIQIYIDKQSDLIDLSRSFVEIDVGFKTTAGGNLTSRNDDVGRMTSFANNLAHTLFKHINVKCNGTLLTEQVDMYHHKAYLQTLLNNDRNDGDTILQATNGGWRNEIDSPVTYTATNVKGDDAAFAALSDNQQASIKAQKKEARDLYSEGKRRILRMKPFVEIFHQGKWIVPRTSFEMDFYLNPASIFSNGESNLPTESVRVHADDVKLSFYMCLVKLNPSTYMDMMGLLSKSAALYPFVRTEMRQYPLDNGATYKEINNPFNNKVPQRFVLAIVENSAFNGRYDQDTFAYQPAGIEYIKQIVDGEEYPYETLELNTGNGRKDVRGYYRFLEATGCLQRGSGNMVRFLDWGYGKNATIFAFSNVPNGRHDDPILLPRPQSTINLRLKCAAQQSQKTIILMSEYEALIEIDGINSTTSMSVH